MRRRPARKTRRAGALEAAPAVVAARNDAIDLLERTLPDVADPELAARSIEAESPGVTEAPGIDLRTVRESGAIHRTAIIAGKRVVVWNRVVARRRIDIEPQDLAEQDRGPLAVADRTVRVVRATAIPDRDVQAPVRTERDPAAVVIALGLHNRDQHALGVRIEREPTVGSRELRDAGHEPELIGGVDEPYAPIRGKGGMKGHPEQPGLTATRNTIGEIDERARDRDRLIVLEYEHATTLLDDEPAARIAGRLQQRHRVRECQIRVDPFDCEARRRHRWRRGRGTRRRTRRSGRRRTRTAAARGEQQRQDRDSRRAGGCGCSDPNCLLPAVWHTHPCIEKWRSRPASVATDSPERPGTTDFPVVPVVRVTRAPPARRRTCCRSRRRARSRSDSMRASRTRQPRSAHR